MFCVYVNYFNDSYDDNMAAAYNHVKAKKSFYFLYILFYILGLYFVFYQNVHMYACIKQAEVGNSARDRPKHASINNGLSIEKFL